MPVRVASHAHPIHTMLKDFGSQRLSKVISQIACRVYLGDCSITSLHNLYDHVFFPLYVFLVFEFLGLSDCPVVITVNYERLSCQRYYSKFHKESFKPNCFLNCFSSSYSINTYPVVDFLESLSDMKSVSVLPTGINSSLLQINM